MVVTLIVDLIVPGAGTVASVLDTIMQLCGEMKEGEESCVRLLDRLTDLLSELRKMEDANQMPPSDVLNKYTLTLERYLTCLKTHRSRGLVSRLIRQKKMMEEIKLLNEDVDMLMRMLSLATTAAMMEWKQQWQKDRVEQQTKINAIVTNDAAVLSELKTLRAQREAMTQLKFQLDERQGQQSEESLVAMRKLLTSLVRTSKSSVPRVPTWFLPAEEVEFDEEPFSRGSFGSVHKGVWCGATKVVVKCLLVDEVEMNPTTMSKFINEVEIWSKLNHPHVIKMFGASHVTMPPFIVCEDATKNGNLASYLVASSTNKKHMWQLLYEAAQGLDYLHRKGIVHGDLKLNNILVGADGLARLADFGLSTAKTSSRSTQTRLTATGGSSAPAASGGLRWRAPECFTARPSFASDVYSLAMCIIEAATDEPPYSYLDDLSVFALVKDGILPSQPTELSDDAWSLVQSLATRDPAMRVQLRDALVELRRLAENEPGSITTESVDPTCDCGVAVSMEGDQCGECWLASSSASTSTSTSNSTSTAPPELTAVEHEIYGLVEHLCSGTDAQKQYAATTLMNLARNDTNRDTIANAGGIPRLVELVRSGTDGQKREAAGALWNIGVSDVNEVLIARAGGVPPLVELVRSGTDSQKHKAAGALYCLSFQSANLDLIVSAGGIAPLVELVRSGTDGQKQEAAGALWKLSFKPDNQESIANAGGIAPLVELLRSGSDDWQWKAAGTLNNLAAHPANQVAIASAGGISPLIQLAKSATGFPKEYAVDALRTLAADASIAALIRDAGGAITLEQAAVGG